MGAHGIPCGREITLYRRYHLVRRGRWIQLYFRIGRGQQAGGEVLGIAGEKAEKTWAASAVHYCHTGWTDNMEFAFAHRNELCSPFKKKVHDPNALYDAYDESDDTEENAKSGFLKGVGR